MNTTVSDYAIITDDTFFAAALSSYLYNENVYVPVISMPRMNRNDWESEVLKRVDCVNRFNFKAIFCREKDYKVLAPFRKYCKVLLIAFNNAKQITRYINIEDLHGKEDCLIKKQDYCSGLIEAYIGKKIIKKEKTSYKRRNTGYYKIFNSETLLVLEKNDSVSDVAALNYAFANKYDILIIEKINEEVINDIERAMVKLADINCIENEIIKGRIFNFLRKRIHNLFEYAIIEGNYEKAQFITNKIYGGFLLEKIQVAHLIHLQSELNILNEYYYANKKESYEFPSFLFVDTQEQDLTSEIPQIIELLDHYKCWKFFLYGKHANMQNFKIFSTFFPYDILLITGHGSSPEGRIVDYSFKDLKGKSHTGRFIEYFQFGRRVGEMIELMTKQYPLEFDGITWKDKKALEDAGIQNIFWVFSLNIERKYIKSIPYQSNKIEGIKLSDGIFTGAISSYDKDNNPVIILNSCSSLLEVGDLINFALPRILIGTLWPVSDEGAKNFAVKLFNNFTTIPISTAFFEARSIIKDNYTRLSYIMLGTLNQFLHISREVQNIEKAKEEMAKRFLSSVDRAFYLLQSGRIDHRDFNTLLKFEEVYAKFIKANYPLEMELRNNSTRLKNFILSQKNSSDST